MRERQLRHLWKNERLGGVIAERSPWPSAPRSVIRHRLRGGGHQASRIADDTTPFKIEDDDEWFLAQRGGRVKGFRRAVFSGFAVPSFCRLLLKIIREAPDLVLVYGDTNSTIAGARAGASSSTPVAHVEAGLRSGDLAMPEEHNRIETDRISWLLFCPDDRSQATLEREGVLGRIYVVGDVMADVFYAHSSEILANAPTACGPYGVLTLHRAATADDPEAVARVLEAVGGAGVPVVLPLHPRTRRRIREFGLQPSGAVRLLYDQLERDMQEAWAIHGVYPTFAWMPDGQSIVEIGRAHV